MCPAAATSKTSSAGKISRNSATLASLTTSLRAPRMSSVGRLRGQTHALDQPFQRGHVVFQVGRKNPRIPVPVQASIGSGAQIAQQSAQILGPRPIGIVGRHRIRGLLQAGKAVGISPHEITNSRNALALRAQHDIDEHQCAWPQSVDDRLHRRDAAHGCTDQGDGLVCLRQHRLQISCAQGVRIDAVGRPTAFAVAPRIVIDRTIARAGQCMQSAGPGMPGLARTVH